MSEQIAKRHEDNYYDTYSFKRELERKRYQEIKRTISRLDELAMKLEKLGASK